jgi:hypothetical protein
MDNLKVRPRIGEIDPRDGLQFLRLFAEQAQAGRHGAREKALYSFDEDFEDDRQLQRRGDGGA